MQEGDHLLNEGIIDLHMWLHIGPACTEADQYKQEGDHLLNEGIIDLHMGLHVGQHVFSDDS